MDSREFSQEVKSRSEQPTSDSKIYVEICGHRSVKLLLKNLM